MTKDDNYAGLLELVKKHDGQAAFTAGALSMMEFELRDESKPIDRKRLADKCKALVELLCPELAVKKEGS